MLLLLFRFVLVHWNADGPMPFSDMFSTLRRIPWTKTKLENVKISTRCRCPPEGRGESTGLSFTVIDAVQCKETCSTGTLTRNYYHAH